MNYKTYHYGDSNIDDCGWGCTYRNIQTIMSAYTYFYNSTCKLPTIASILEFFQKDIRTPIKKTLWLEPYEAGRYLYGCYGIKSNHLIYIRNDSDILKILTTDISVYLTNNRYTNNFNIMFSACKKHFNTNKLPIIIDNGVYSYCILSIKDNIIKISDPHTLNNNNELEKSTDFLKNSFWMIMIPDR